MDGCRVVWDFTYRDGFWEPLRTPPADENLLLAVETLAISFGKRARAVQLFLNELDRVRLAHAGDVSVNVTTAYVRKAGPEEFEICDKYGQFADVAVSGAELTSLLSVLMRKVESEFPGSHRG